MEKISDYDEHVQEQMRIIYSLNKYLNLDTRITLEKVNNFFIQCYNALF